MDSSTDAPADRRSTLIPRAYLLFAAATPLGLAHHLDHVIRVDILLRVNAEESRAVGVSGSQSDHRTTSPFGHG
jgi:hypothetical protein